MKTLIAGTRGSRLARAQCEGYLDQLRQANPEIAFETKMITTQGDRDQKRALSEMDNKGIFTTDIEQALITKEIDFAVHSMKDMPDKLPEGLKLVRPPKREKAGDVLLTRCPARRLSDLPHGLTVGTGSLRRACQLRQERPDFKIKDIRGNVDTRLRKLFEKDRFGRPLYDAVILAQAGLARLGISEQILHNNGIYSVALDFIPAPAQGILAVEIREDDTELQALLESVSDDATALQADIERGFLRALDGNCKVPIAAWCELKDGRGRLRTLFGNVRGESAALISDWKSKEELPETARACARQLKAVLKEKES